MSGIGDSPKVEGRSLFSSVPRCFLVAEARG
jgi:hypothetical protein